MTIYFNYNAESGNVNDTLPNPDTTEAFWTEGPGCYPGCGYTLDEHRGHIKATLTPPQGSKYFEFWAHDDAHDYYTECSNRPLFHDTAPMDLTLGATYYLGWFERIERTGSPKNDVWHLTGDSADKGVEIYGSGLRWGRSQGHWGSLANNQSAKYTIWGSDLFHLNPENEVDDILPLNQAGYSISNPIQVDYERWYAFVFGLKIASDHTGSWQIWINGTKVQEFLNIQTVNTGSPTLSNIRLGGTLAQSAYDCPEHYQQYDVLILTDSWSDIQAAGLDQDPEEGSASATPSSTVSPSSSKSCSISRSRSKSMSQSQSSSPSPSPSGGYDYPRFVVHSSTNITDGESTTHQLVPPGAKQYEDFQDGKIHDVSNPANPIDLDIDKYTEIEWCVQATEYAEVGETYEFRVAKGE